MGAFGRAAGITAGILAVGFTLKTCVTEVFTDGKEPEPDAIEKVEPVEPEGPSYERRVGREVARSFVDVIAGLAEGALEAVNGLVDGNGETIDVYRDEAGRIFNEAGERLGINLDGRVLPMKDCIENIECVGSTGIEVAIDNEGNVIGYEDIDGNYISLEEDPPNFDYNPDP